MTGKELITAISEEFNEILQQKTGWGRLEIMRAFDRACALALMKLAGGELKDG